MEAIVISVVETQKKLYSEHTHYTQDLSDLSRRVTFSVCKQTKLWVYFIVFHFNYLFSFSISIQKSIPKSKEMMENELRESSEEAPTTFFHGVSWDFCQRHEILYRDQTMRVWLKKSSRHVNWWVQISALVSTDWRLCKSKIAAVLWSQFRRHFSWQNVHTTKLFIAKELYCHYTAAKQWKQWK